MAHFLRKRGTEEVFIYTTALSLRNDMQLLAAKDLKTANKMAKRSLALEKQIENTVVDEEESNFPAPLTELQLAAEEDAAGLETGGGKGNDDDPGGPGDDDTTGGDGGEETGDSQNIALSKPLDEMTKAELNKTSIDNFGVELDLSDKRDDLISKVQSFIDKSAA